MYGRCAASHTLQTTDVKASHRLESHFSDRRREARESVADFDSTRIHDLSPSGSFRAYTFWTLSEARSRLYQRRFLRARAHFSAFFKLYIFSFAPFQISVIFQAFAPFFAKNWRSFCKISKKTAYSANFRQISTDFVRNFGEFLQSLEKKQEKEKKAEYSAFFS